MTTREWVTGLISASMPALVTGIITFGVAYSTNKFQAGQKAAELALAREQQLHASKMSYLDHSLSSRANDSTLRFLVMAIDDQKVASWAAAEIQHREVEIQALQNDRDAAIAAANEAVSKCGEVNQKLKRTLTELSERVQKAPACAKIQGTYRSSIDGLILLVSQQGCVVTIVSTNSAVMHRADFVLGKPGEPSGLKMYRTENGTTCSWSARLVEVSAGLELQMSAGEGSPCGSLPGRSTTLTRITP